MVRRGIAFFAKLNLLACPADWQLRQHLGDPAVATGVAEQDQVTATHVLLRDRGIVLDGKLAAEVAAPFVSEALEAGVGPRLHRRVPRLPRAADAQEG